MRQMPLNGYRTSASCSSTQPRRERRRRKPTKIAFTPLRGFLIALLFGGIPTVLLGSLCLTLFQHNAQLSEKNSELEEMATEVKAEVDSLGEEIDSLSQQVGAPKDSSQSGRGDAAQNPAAASSQSGRIADNLPPRGGPAPKIDALDLLKNASRQVPELNKTLDSAIKPALEAAIAQEAAYPDGQPIAGKVEVSSEFGIRSNPFGGSGYEVHGGIDFVGEHGDIIAATGDGVVVKSGENGGYGISVTLDHGNGYETLYAHMSKARVQVGDRIKRGQIIGYIGSTGRSSGPHLHYSLYKEGVAIDPRKIMKLPASASPGQ